MHKKKYRRYIQLEYKGSLIDNQFLCLLRTGNFSYAFLSLLFSILCPVLFI